MVSSIKQIAKQGRNLEREFPPRWLYLSRLVLFVVAVLIHSNFVRSAIWVKLLLVNLAAKMAPH
jgi:hypothetical protein